MKFKRIEIHSDFKKFSLKEKRELNSELAVISRVINLNLDLNSINISNLGQITISLIDEDREMFVVANSSLNKVCWIGRPFTIDEYLSSKWATRKTTLLDFVFESIRILCELSDWDYKLFEKARNLILEKGYKTEFGITKKTFSPNRKVKAFLTIDYITGRDADLYLYVMDKQDVLIKKLLIINLKPVIFYLGELLWDIKWIDNNELEVFNVNGIKTYHINIENNFIDPLWKKLEQPLIFSGDWQVPL